MTILKVEKTTVINRIVFRAGDTVWWDDNTATKSMFVLYLRPGGNQKKEQRLHNDRVEGRPGMTTLCVLSERTANRKKADSILNRKVKC